MAHRTFGWVAFDGEDYVAACHHFREVLSLVRDLGAYQAEPRVLAGLGCVAVQVGDLESAMRLFAAEARVAESADMQTPSSFLDRRHEPFVEAARQSLGREAEKLWSEGWALGQEQIRAEAASVTQAAADARLARTSGAWRRAL